MSAEINKEQILRRFEQWLDDALTSEEPPGGIGGEILSALTADAEGNSELDRSCDSYALWAAMTALTQEVKLQGRAFKELSETLGLQPSRIGEEMRAAYRERDRELQREVERRCRREILSALVDLRDRLGRGLESVEESALEIAKAAEAGWLQRLLAKPGKDPAVGMLTALRKGYELGVERLDQTLDEFNAREILCEGQPFDPRRMNAIDREESDAVPEGTVLEVYRSGYEWNGEVFRPAQVKVSSAPVAGKEK